jgi:hypothetical protein
MMMLAAIVGTFVLTILSIKCANKANTKCEMSNPFRDRQRRDRS